MWARALRSDRQVDPRGIDATRKEIGMAKSLPHTQKVTISLAQDLLRYADQQAEALGRSRSQIIGHALAELRAREADALAREGYAFYAREAEDFAAVSLAASSEVVRHDD